MLSEFILKELVNKQQTTEINIDREYFQHLFLSNLYQLKGTERLAFKGGTALKVIYNSPRFSEDLDFTADIKIFHLENLLTETIEKLKLEGLNISPLESKETSGGYFAIYETKIYTSNIRVELNISLRHYKRMQTQIHLITTPFQTTYTLIALSDKLLIQEKIEALLYRHKPRDFFDLYFMLRNRISIGEVLPYQSQLKNIISKYDSKNFTRELKIFLPKSHWNLLNNFPEKLRNELSRL